MKKTLVLMSVVGSPLLLALPILLPKVAFMIVLFATTGLTNILLIVLPILVVGFLGLLGEPASDSLMFLL